VTSVGIAVRARETGLISRTGSGRSAASSPRAFSGRIRLAAPSARPARTPRGGLARR
jgi:hypothetical protein